MAFKCLSAINWLHDLERERRQRDGVSDDASWTAHCEELRQHWHTGEYSDKCGKDAVIALIHMNGGFLPYCVDHFAYDGAVANAAYMTVLLPGFSENDANRIHELSPCLVKWYPQSCPSLRDFECAALAYLRAAMDVISAGGDSILRHRAVTQ